MVTFTEEILMENFIFFCAVSDHVLSRNQSQILNFLNVHQRVLTENDKSISFRDTAAAKGCWYIIFFNHFHIFLSKISKQKIFLKNKSWSHLQSQLHNGNQKNKLTSSTESLLPAKIRKVLVLHNSPARKSIKNWTWSFSCNWTGSERVE